MRFQPTVALLEWTAAADAPPAGLIIASPANPTGTVIAPDELAAIALVRRERRAARERRDYHGVTFGEQAASAGRPRGRPCSWAR